jgi:predicted small secreted protein
LTTTRTLTALLVLVAAIVAACNGGEGDGASTKPAGGSMPSPGQVFAGTPSGNTTSTASGSAPTGTAITVADGAHDFTLLNSGFGAELLIAVRGGQLVVSQLTISNDTGSFVEAVPRLRYIDGAGRTFDAITEPDWRRLYPAGSGGLANGQHAQIRVGFPQRFDPATVTFCITLGVTDLGCMNRRSPTPAAR